MSDLAEQLRKTGQLTLRQTIDAADEIERLRDMLEKLSVDAEAHYRIDHKDQDGCPWASLQKAERCLRAPSSVIETDSNRDTEND